MLTKIKLFHQIKKFYKIYGDLLDSDFIHKLADITPNNLYDVQFDINEVLEANALCFYKEAYELDAWLNKLNKDIQNFREGKVKHGKSIIFVLILIALATVVGYNIGRHNTITSAELYTITENGYEISFGDEVHSYIFEEVR